MRPPASARLSERSPRGPGSAQPVRSSQSNDGEVKRRSFKVGTGNWMQYRALANSIEVYLHSIPRERKDVPYAEAMKQVSSAVLDALRSAQHNGRKYVLFTHMISKPGRWKTTTRSRVRKVMRSRRVTPFIIRKDCIQHDSVFVAAVKPA